ncbi:LysM peptidoglycan-binding domain-containing protein [Thermodesulfobacteriota bacterium]
MNNPNDHNNKDFVMRGSDGDDNAMNEYDNQDHESTNESFRKWLSMPLILGAVGFLILNILIVFISSSTDSTGSEQISVIEIRLDRIEAELISIAEHFEKLRSVKRTTVEQNSTTAKKASSAQRKQKSIKPKLYKVQSGDSLSKIGQQFGLSVEQLREYNRLAPNAIIHPGQELKLVP